ncbi:unnamed protein product, partial [Rotaria sp. Silwood1]
MQILLILVQ